MSSSSTARGGGITFFGALGILFIGLKLTGHIDWSWLWVTAPLWMPLSILLGILALILVGVLIGTGVDVIRFKMKKK